MSEHEDLRRHLTEAGPANEDRAGVALDAVLHTVSVVSTDMGKLATRLEHTTEETTRRLDGLDEELTKLGGDRETVAALTEHVAELRSLVEDLAGGEDDDGEGPPQPWDWAAMGWEERLESLELLAAWLHNDLFTWWPWTQTMIPPCWHEHADMQRNLSTLYVAYQQAYKYPSRRVHHELDFQRVLQDMTKLTEKLKGDYSCEGKDGQRHYVWRTVRNDAQPVRESTRAQLLTRIYRMGKAADDSSKGRELRESARDETDRLMAKYRITEEEWREKVLEVLDQLNRFLREESQPQTRRESAEEELGRLQKKYDITAEEYTEFWNRRHGRNTG